MKTKHILAIAIVLWTQNLSAQEQPDQKPIIDMFVLAKITVVVQDESGAPVSDAKLHIEFSHNNGAFIDGHNDYFVRADVNGKFVAESECTGAIWIMASKDGYYQSSLEYQPTDWSKKHERGEKLQPWNPTIPIVLKKIGKAIPMYARGAPRKTVFLPSQDALYGYDLIEDDWMAPHGKGKVEDLKMLAHMDLIDGENYDAKLSIKFSNKGDGWIPLRELKGIESEMKYPREAPIDGYISDPIMLTYRARKKHEITLGGNPYGYILRLRTKLDETDHVVSAIYAKIIDGKLNPPVDPRRLENPILFGAGPELMKEKGRESGCYFEMLYYLNPTPNDRSLEFDRKNNLAKEVDRAPSDLAP